MQTQAKLGWAVALVSACALGCHTPGVKDGALTGGALGVLIGVATGSDNRSGEMIGGAAIGSLLGGFIGWMTADLGAGGRDSDADGISDIQDNCPMDVNRDQQDVDGDGKGDRCDTP